MDTFWSDVVHKIVNAPDDAPKKEVNPIEPMEDSTVSQENEENLDIISLGEKDDTLSSSSDVEILEKESFEEKFSESPDPSFVHVENGSIALASDLYSPELALQQDAITNKEEQNYHHLEKSEFALKVSSQNCLKINTLKNWNGIKEKIEETFFQPQRYSFPFAKFVKLSICLLSTIYLIRHIHVNIKVINMDTDMNRTNFETLQLKLQKLENIVGFWENFQMECVAFQEQEAKTLEEFVKKIRIKTNSLNSKVKCLTRSLGNLESSLMTKKKRQKKIRKQPSTKVSDWKKVIGLNKHTVNQSTASCKAVQQKFSNLNNQSMNSSNNLAKEDAMNLNRAESENMQLTKPVLELCPLNTTRTVSDLGVLTRGNFALKPDCSGKRGRWSPRRGDAGRCGDKFRLAVSIFSKQFL